jgi:hypothetical protein
MKLVSATGIRWCRLLATVAAASLFAACDRDPVGTTGPTPAPPSPPGPPFVTSLEISGPGVIAPGESAQFTAFAHLSDGTRKPAEHVRWVTRQRILLVDQSSGLATGGPVPGEDVVIAQLPPGSVGSMPYASKEILVLPAGTFRMVGTVTEDVPPAAPIFGARVELASGMSGGGVTDQEGRYRIYGVPASADIRVSRDGYHPRVQRVQLTGHLTQDFQLGLSGVRLGLTGSYLLTVDAACATSTPVREDVRHLVYAARLTQTDARVDVELTEGPRFRVNVAGRGNRFSGHVDAAGATFDLGDSFYPYYGSYDPSIYPHIVERIPDGTFLTLDGRVAARGSGAALAGDLRGFFAHYSSRFPDVTSPGAALGTCYSTVHGLRLTRQ